MKRIDLLEEMNHAGYKAALFTSYSTDLVFFEKMILRYLLDNGCTYIGLFIDHHSLQESITKPNISELGKSYAVTPMITDNAFHPKVFLLVGEKKAKLIIGSSNLTPSGFITNKELCNVFTFEVGGDNKYLHLIQAALDFFIQLKPTNNQIMNEVFKCVDSFSYLKDTVTSENTNLYFLSNIKSSIQDQLVEFLPDSIHTIDCLVPYFDRSLSVVHHWDETYTPDKISIYLQNKTSNFPLDNRNSSLFRLFEIQFKEDTDKRYHGKAFRFIGEAEEVLVYGSANCSSQALLQNYTEGNTESVIVETAPKGTFNYLFDEEFKREPLTESFKLMPEENNSVLPSPSVQFIEGFLDGNVLTVRMRSKLDVETVQLEGEKGTITFVDYPYLTITFSECTEKLKGIFSLEVTAKGKKESLYGWFHNKESLLQSFENLKNSPYHKLENDQDMEDYQTIIALLDDLNNRLILNEENLERSSYQRKTAAIHQRAELGDNKGISDNPDDYIAADDDQDQVYGSIGGVDVLSNLIRALQRHFQKPYSESTPLIISTDSEPSNTKSLKESNEQWKSLIEKRMKRFMKKFNQGITSQNYLEKVDSDVLVKNIAIYNGFLWKLHSSLKEWGFASEKLVEETLKLVSVMESYCKMNILDESQFEVKDLVTKLLTAILAKERLLAEDDNFGKVRVEKKRLAIHLKNIHQKIYPIRETYPDFIDQIIRHLNQLRINASSVEIEQLLESRFPILTFNVFLEQLKSKGNLLIVKNPTLEEPTIKIRRQVGINAEFNSLQLELLCMMLSVEEWEMKSNFKIISVNTNKQAHLKGIVLYYNPKKSILKRKIVYREHTDLEHRLQEKKHVYKNDLLNAFERKDVQIIGNGFK